MKTQFTLSKDIGMQSGKIFPKGTVVNIVPSEKSGAHLLCTILDTDKTFYLSYVTATSSLKGFPKQPSIKTMEQWMDRGICKSISGNDVEPDGIDQDGYPSWMLALESI